MQIKKLLAGIGIGASISAGSYMACDYAFLGKGAVNYVYCSLDNMVNGFEKKEITEVTFAFYAEHTGNRGCYMNPGWLLGDLNWCEERETIEKYKRRFW